MVSGITAGRPVCLKGQFRSKCDLRGAGELSKAGNLSKLTMQTPALLKYSGASSKSFPMQILPPSLLSFPFCSFCFLDT